MSSQLTVISKIQTKLSVFHHPSFMSRYVLAGKVCLHFCILSSSSNMNSQIIEKVIKSNDANTCPEFTYENPLLDRNVARALSRSFVKILRVSQKNSNINNNLRHAVLANIRKTCRIEPEKHVEIGENIINLLTEAYIEEIENQHTNQCTNQVEKDLDDFITRRLVELDINSNYQSSLNPEIAQSLINLDERSLETISQNVLNIDIRKKKSLTLIKDLWTKPVSESATNNIGDISISMKPEIEKILLNLCHSLLTEQNLNLKELLCLSHLKDLAQKCSISPECFQICCGILNSIFSAVNFALILQLFITEFVRKVKETCSNSISILYPFHLCHIAFLLDIDIGKMPEDIQGTYIKNTLPYLKKLHTESKTDFTLILTHNPDWFDIYFEK